MNASESAPATASETAPRPVLIDGHWRPAEHAATFRAADPATGERFEESYPVSDPADVTAAVTAGRAAAAELARLPAEARAAFLEDYADRLDAAAEELAAIAARETGLARAPRLAEVELPRTTDQLRQAARAARERSWILPEIDTAAGLRSQLEPLGGPVAVFGPNNFPLAFNAVSGGDFAAAVAAGNPVIAKGHPAHPATTRRLAELAVDALAASELPAATLQLLYHMEPETGLELAAHPDLAAVAFTGSQRGGLALKEAADRAGTPIYLEMGSVNPVAVLPGALEERFDEIVAEYAGSCLLAAGQFCTNPGLLIVPSGEAGERFVTAAAERFAAAEVGPLFSEGAPGALAATVEELVTAGAERVTAGAGESAGAGYRFAPTLLRVDAEAFLRAPERLQTEAFGPVGLAVLAEPGAMTAVAGALHGGLTASVYSHTDGRDDALYDALEPLLRPRVGRLINDAMPTGVAVSPAMVHGGPHPATGHPGFTSVGVPAALRRFGALRAYDRVRPHRLPPELQNANPLGIWRRVDGTWTRDALDDGA